MSTPEFVPIRKRCLTRQRKKREKKLKKKLKKNTYRYDPAKGAITAKDGSVVSVSLDEARRRAPDHMYNNIGRPNL